MIYNVFFRKKINYYSGEINTDTWASYLAMVLSFKSFAKRAAIAWQQKWMAMRVLAHHCL